ncbi:MAG: hypothetical protein JW795_18195, partial [Chitinivibrionales bacterium]|nr:hypothetical protein [Chitinivibrionales bacterium]
MKQSQRRRFTALFLVTLAICINTCNKYPVSMTSDYIEKERVWQHLTSFSIYQERIPSENEALNSLTPAGLVFSIGDTMYSKPNKEHLRLGVYIPAGRIPDLTEETYGGQSVYGKKVSPTLFYIRINTFLDTSLITAMVQYTPSVASATGLIIDLRSNPGGYIIESQYVLELLLARQVPYLKAQIRKYNEITAQFETATETWATSEPDSGFFGGWQGRSMVVLTNRRTASASEIVTSGLRDGAVLAKRLILGDTTYGKAIGQYRFLFASTSGAQLSLTGHRFYGLKGFDYHEVGIP